MCLIFAVTVLQMMGFLSHFSAPPTLIVLDMNIRKMLPPTKIIKTCQKSIREQALEFVIISEVKGFLMHAEE